MPGSVQLVLLLSLLLTSVLASHFRGSIIMARPQPGGAEYEMEIFYQISWRRDRHSCDSDTVASGSLLSGEGYLRCISGCSGSIAAMSFICTDFSVNENWSFGENRLVYDFAAAADETVTIGYSGGNWIAPFNSRWNIPTTFSLRKRNDTGRINSTPRAITAPVIRMQEGCNHTIALAVSDPDGDIIRCRWAEGYECGGICNQFPGAELVSNPCIINYQANRGARFWAAALMIEDFLPNSSLPLSSVALQFLVLVVRSTEPCSQKPEFIPPTIHQGACIAIPPGSTFHTQLTAFSGGFGASIVEIQTTSPLGTSKGELVHVEDSDVYFVNISWTPEIYQQNETHLFCFTAVNSHGQSSEQRCIQFFPGHYPPMPIQATATPNRQLVDPSNTTLRVNFDADIERPSRTAYISFHEFNAEDRVYRIDASMSQDPEVTFRNSNEILITPKYMFAEKQTFFIKFERGIVQNPVGCKPGNEPVNNKTFWTFETMDVTPPAITFLENPLTSNANVSFSWESNENVTWQCKLINGTTEFRVSCDEAYWRGYMLNEGLYDLHVKATDEAGNMATAIHAFEVDLTPPATSIVQKPALLSNQQTVTLRFTCNEICSFECEFFSTLKSDVFPCNQGVFVTSTLEHNTSYTFSVAAQDQVGNKGEIVSYTWETDFESPRVFGVRNMTVIPCSDTSPNHTGQAQAVDNRPEMLALTYNDVHLGCFIRRTWTATDGAGNIAVLIQKIVLEFIPSVTSSPQVAFPCDSTASSIHVPTTTASAPNPCGLPLHLTHEDSVHEYVCPSNFMRTWIVTVCNSNATVSQTIDLYDLCPPNACGRNESTPRGVCTLGHCQCNRPWHDVDCSILIYEPKIMPLNDTVLQEAQEYSSIVPLSQGTSPLSWTLLSGPELLTLDQLTGQVTWKNAQAGNHTVSVQVENQVGTAEVAWMLCVKPGYNAVLFPVSPNIYPRAQPITITGRVDYKSGNLVGDFLARVVPVHIDITSNGATRTVKAFTSPDGSFSTVFYPVSTEYGTYIAGARHPSSLTFVPQTEWNILGMKAAPRNILLNGEAVREFEKTFYNATIVCNDGPATLHGVAATPSPLIANSNHIRVQFLVRGAPFNVTLEPGDKVAIDITVAALRPLSVLFPVVLEATSTTTLRLAVNVQIEPILPLFLINPPSVNTRAIRGQSRVLEFNVTNVGRAIAHSVHSILPETNLFSFVSFGSPQQSEGNLSLKNGESAALSILVQVPVNQQLGEITATVVIMSREVSKSIQVTLTVSSNVLMNLTVIVEDEYTYFASTQPLVSTATVTLINYQRNLRIVKTTETGNGTVNFLDIHEDRYEMFVEAPSHRTLHQIIITSIDMPVVTVFIERQAVTYTWSVTPITFEDTYTLIVEADFQTHVPIPVFTVTPTEIDLDKLERGFMNSIQLNITNHGLIRANAVNIQLPNDHPFLEFTTITDDFGDLEPLSSIIVTVETDRKKLEKRGIIFTIYLFNIVYSYVCGELQVRTIPVVLKKQEETSIQPSDSSFTFNDYSSGAGAGAGAGAGSSFSFNGYSSRTVAFCNKCLQSLLGCVPGPFPFSGCIPLIITRTGLDSISNVVSWTACLTNNNLLSLLSCMLGVYDNCLNRGPPIFSRRKRQNLESTVNELVEAMYPVHLSIALGTEIFGNRLWLSVGDPNWLASVLRPALDDRSEGGVLISSTELSAILVSPPPNRTNMEIVTEMVERLNNTLYGWNNGHLEPQEDFNMASFNTVQEITDEISSYNEIAKSKGFSSYLEAYNFAASEYNKIGEKEEEAGVCAVVRIRIEQELAVTREAFLAKLEIENQEDSPLEQIEMKIVITDSVTGSEATHLFSIGDGMLSGSLIIASLWSLPSEMSGAIEWLIIPYSEAAPESSHVYDVGGTLFYVLDGKNITIPLLPTKITVTPDPSLRVHYFWEKNVVGDNPFTDEIEPSVPFTLGVAVMNAGYGTANSLQITSGQPEIIENSKGLLVNFMIIGANIGNESISPSLTVTFGDLAPNMTKVARWFILSSLQGEFKNYSATFENVNPLGDPKLSILDELEIHELIRNVMIYGSTEEDGILDFLVNERKDFLGYPDALYSSKTLQQYSVHAGTILSVRTTSSRAASVEVRTSSNTTGWVYYRHEDTQGILSRTASTVNTTKRESGNTISIPLENSWITRDQGDSTTTDTWYLHIVDFVESTDEVVFTMNLCMSDCRTEERPFERPVVTVANSSVGITTATAFPQATPAPTETDSESSALPDSFAVKTSVSITAVPKATPESTGMPTEMSSEDNAKQDSIIAVYVALPIIAGVVIIVVFIAIVNAVVHTSHTKKNKV